MSKRAAFYEAYRDDRTLLIDDLEPYFDGCSDGTRFLFTQLKRRLLHEEETVWRPALDQIADMIREDADA